MVDADQLPAGDVKFQLMVHDGFQTVTTTTDVVSLPPRPPVVAILYPRSSDQVYARSSCICLERRRAPGVVASRTIRRRGTSTARRSPRDSTSGCPALEQVRTMYGSSVTAGDLTGSAAERIDVSPVNGIPGPR